MNKLIINVKTMNLLKAKSKVVKSKHIFSFENNLDENIGMFNLKAEFKNDVLEGKIYLNNKEVENFYLADKSTYVFIPKLFDVMTEYTLELQRK